MNPYAFTILSSAVAGQIRRHEDLLLLFVFCYATTQLETEIYHGTTRLENRKQNADTDSLMPDLAHWNVVKTCSQQEIPFTSRCRLEVEFYYTTTRLENLENRMLILTH